MKLFNVLLFLLITNLAFAQFPVGTGCFTYKYVPTKLDSSIEVIPAVTQFTPAIYKDTTEIVVVKPEYTEQFIDCTNGGFKICSKTIPAVKVCVVRKILLIPSQEVIIKPAQTIKHYTVVSPAHVEQVPCTN